MLRFFLGAFAKFAESYYFHHVCLSVRPPIRIELGSYWSDVYEI
jgi:hypothetical protein